jgi:hypothetical protein
VRKAWCLAVVGLTVSLSAACNDVDGIFACTRDARPGIYVAVVDSATNEPVRSTSIRGIATENSFLHGIYSDTATIVAPDASPHTSLYLAWEHAGTFTVSVDAPGYRTWTADHVVVRLTEQKCHVVTVNLTARMQRNE